MQNSQTSDISCLQRLAAVGKDLSILECFSVLPLCHASIMQCLTSVEYQHRKQNCIGSMLAGHAQQLSAEQVRDKTALTAYSQVHQGTTHMPTLSKLLTTAFESILAQYASPVSVQAGNEACSLLTT